MSEEKNEEVTSEEVQASEDSVQYEIVDGDLDGVKVRGVRANGNVLFTVGESFTDEQIEEAFNLCNKFFNDGLSFGRNQNQATTHQALGLHDLVRAMIAEELQKALAPAEEEEA